MQKINHIIILLILITSSNLYAQEIEPLAFTELRIGYGWSKFIKYSFQIELETKSKKHEKYSFLFEYFYSQENGSMTIINPGVTQKYTFPIWRSFGYANIKWHPIRNYKNPFSWLFITGGVGYSRQWFSNNIIGDYGIGAKIGVGVQYVYKERLTSLIKTQYFYYYNLNFESPSRIKFDGVPVTFSIGYRFFK